MSKEKPGLSALEEIEHLLAQNKVLEAIERLRSLPDHRREAVNFSRRWHAIQDKKHKGTLTEEQVETEVNKIVEAVLAIAAAEAAPQSAESSRQEAAEIWRRVAAEGSRQSTTRKPLFPMIGSRTTPQSAKPPQISLRSEARRLSEDEMDQVIQQYRGIQNKFEVRGEVIVDHATGLMWQQSGSEGFTRYEDALEYVEQLNRRQFAGYADWRLPTLPELISLLEATNPSSGMRISPLFDSAQESCWSADKIADSANSGWGSDSAWHFAFGGNLLLRIIDRCYQVRCVRSEPTRD